MEAYQLSQEERQIITDAEWLLRKNEVIQKVYHLFGAMHEALAADPVISRFPGDGAQPAKISRGEQYLGLPWVVLDYPRVFGKDNIFACRTFFWWGRFFSTTLHMAGAGLEPYRAVLTGKQHQLAADGWYICVQEDPWQHHFEPVNYQPVADISSEQWEELVQNRSFVKLAKRFDVLTWGKMISNAVAVYAALLDMLSAGDGD
ncbi:hypothetical protein [Chitinophaga sp. XS-30]|uniref:hypothetical protein n=1 Tax=Chitinophaga sp. XS-30 TaxID=2604421 RepID=UPI0011DCA4B7|nr:hypothetical protein [Chitinophaga sp. XS-30]QEH39630.1 hypothetical protein FW415_01605 [Chitinophaga sp. XS-30]